MKQSQITYWCHEIIRSQAEEGGYYIDATMGKGNDTLFLCELAGEKGKDIFREAIIILQPHTGPVLRQSEKALAY